MKVVTIIVPGTPRTKKNSPQIVRAMGRAVLVPSKAYKGWFRDAMTYAGSIRAQLAAAGLELPITAEVSVAAVFYRDALRGDATGYYDGLADWLQAPRVRNGRQTRNGAGIIDDDRQIRDWDGSRLLKDADNPRIEARITILEEPQGRLELQEQTPCA